MEHCTRHGYTNGSNLTTDAGIHCAIPVSVSRLVCHLVSMCLFITTSVVTSNALCLTVPDKGQHLKSFIAAFPGEIGKRQPSFASSRFCWDAHTLQHENTTTCIIVSPEGTADNGWQAAPHLAQGQGFEVCGPERRSVGTVKPVVGSQVGRVDVPRVAGSEVVGQVVGGVLFGELG